MLSNSAITILAAIFVLALHFTHSTEAFGQTPSDTSPSVAVSLDVSQLQPCEALSQIDVLAEPPDSETLSASDRVKWYQSQAMSLNFSQPDQAMIYVCASRALAEVEADASGLAESSRIIGILFYSRDQRDAARHWIDQSIAAYAELNDNLQLGKAYNVRGALSARGSDYSSALQDFNSAIKFFEQAGDLRELSRAQSNTANLLMLIGDHQRGIEYMQYVADGNIERGEHVSAGISYSNMATSYFSEMDEPELAQTYANLAVETLEKADTEALSPDEAGLYNSYLAQALIQRARIHNALQQYPQAMRDIDQIAPLIANMNSPEEELVFDTVRAVAFSNTGRLEEAVDIARQAMQRATELPDPHTAIALTSEIAQVLASAGEYEDAYEQIVHGLYRTREERSAAVSNAVIRANIEFDLERAQQTALFATQRANLAETESAQQRRFLILLTVGLLTVGAMALVLFNVNGKRRLAIAGLTRTNDELDSAKSRLVRLLSDREMLLREINHRVKNNLQIVASLMGMQARAAPNSDAQNVLGHMQTRVNSMALIHNQLYSESLDQVIEMQDYFEEFAKMLDSAYSSSDLRINVTVAEDANIQLDVDTAVPLALLMSELVTNAVAHAFPKESEQDKLINISLTTVGEEMLRLSVEDNGVGIKVDELTSDTSEGFGMSLIKDLSTQLGGDYSFEASSMGGTQISITFVKPTIMDSLIHE